MGMQMVDAGQAQVQGRVQWGRDTLVLDRIDASNDRFDLLARLRLRGQNRQGSLYAKWGGAERGRAGGWCAEQVPFAPCQAVV